MRVAPTAMLLLSTCLAAPATVQATVRNVPADVPRIQQALEASSSGDEVVVAPGTYLETIALGAAQSGVHLRSSGGPDVTIIDGGHAFTTVTCVGVTSGIIEGFTITGGGTLGATTIGAGMNLMNSNLEVKNNIIRDNLAQAAGGIYVDGGAPTIDGNTIKNNHAPGGSGGGIYCDHVATPLIQGNVIVDNTCGAFGGGVTSWLGSDPTLVSNTIVGNQAAFGGGGLYVRSTGHMHVSRTIVAYSNNGGVVLGDNQSDVTLDCSDAFGSPPLDYIGMENPAGTNGNQSADPLFCDLSGRDLHLSDFSPCAAANSPASCNLVGALGPACSPTPTLHSTWGRLKATYR